MEEIYYEFVAPVEAVVLTPEEKAALAIELIAGYEEKPRDPAWNDGMFRCVVSLDAAAIVEERKVVIRKNLSLVADVDADLVRDRDRIRTLVDAEMSSADRPKTEEALVLRIPGNLLDVAKSVRKYVGYKCEDAYATFEQFTGTYPTVPEKEPEEAGEIGDP